ncbi:MAG: aspartate-semialdehyde dehydrogenase [Spirochaetes bacterium]|nr:aspartate-semialdehyde dehydrogenase [Spirochaetota bacterium]
MSKINVAVVGATGAVGREMIKTLEQRKFPVKNLRLLASSRSKGLTIQAFGKDVEVEELNKDSFNKKDIRIALFSPGSKVSKIFAPLAAENGVLVIDNTSAFRMMEEVPLVVPEVNPEDAKKHKGIIANPNCSTIQMVVALKPLYDHSRIRRIVVTTFQSVSGAGLKAMNELRSQTENYLKNEKIKAEKFPYQIAFNCLPHIGDFLENGYTQEEEKMIKETHKIMHDSEIKITATTVRVPVFIGHAESVNIETQEKIPVNKAIQLLKKGKGLKVIDNPEKSEYPLQIDCEGKDEVFVGRLREDTSSEKGLNMWVVSDNLRKGAALNAVQIAELFL